MIELPNDAGELLTFASVPIVPNVNPIVEFVSDEFPMLVKVFVEPEIVLFVNVCASSRLASVLVVPLALYFNRCDVLLYQMSPLTNVDGSVEFPVNRISALILDAEKICLLPLV